MEAGADVTLQSNGGIMAIHVSVSQGSIRVLQLLLAAQPPVNQLVRNKKILDWYFGMVGQLKVKSEIAVLLFASGETTDINIGRFAYRDFLKELGEVAAAKKDGKTPVLPPDSYCLKSFCREAIRRHLLSLNSVNPFTRIAQLRNNLPGILIEYLLYDMSLDTEYDDDYSEGEFGDDDDDDDDDNDDDDDDHHHHR